MEKWSEYLKKKIEDMQRKYVAQNYGLDLWPMAQEAIKRYYD